MSELTIFSKDQIVAQITSTSKLFKESLYAQFRVVDSVQQFTITTRKSLQGWQHVATYVQGELKWSRQRPNTAEVRAPQSDAMKAAFAKIDELAEKQIVLEQKLAELTAAIAEESSIKAVRKRIAENGLA